MFGDTDARALARTALHGRAEVRVPDLVYAEVVHALARYVRAGRLPATRADATLGYVRRLPLVSVRCEALALDALSLAVDRGVSGYDAMYLALAEATDAVLVTADRRLAAAATRSELLD